MPSTNPKLTTLPAVEQTPHGPIRVPKTTRREAGRGRETKEREEAKRERALVRRGRIADKDRMGRGGGMIAEHTGRNYIGVGFAMERALWIRTCASLN